MLQICAYIASNAMSEAVNHSMLIKERDHSSGVESDIRAPLTPQLVTMTDASHPYRHVLHVVQQDIKGPVALENT